MTEISNDANDIRNIGENNGMQNAGSTETEVSTCCCHKADNEADEAAPETENTGCECCRHKQRSEKEYRDLITRLNRIEGQIRGIKGMLDDSAYCLDILTQVSAASSALNSFSKLLLANHIKSCVAEDIREGREDKLDELIKFMPKLMK